jgi:hypothetical protein
VGLFRSRAEKAAIAEARHRSAEWIARLSQAAPGDVAGLLPAAPADVSLLPSKEQHSLRSSAFLAYADNVLRDDRITVEEEASVRAVAYKLGIEQHEFETEFRDTLRRLAIAKLNDGRLDQLPEPRLITKRGEVVHAELTASLMKEVAVREWRSGSSGYSFRIAKGLTYRVGQTRGRSVVVGTELQVEDAGALSISSQRIAFLGGRKTLEIPYTKLMGLEVFSDGIRFSASNRQRAPLFTLEPGFGDLAAATINAAMQRI